MYNLTLKNIKDLSGRFLKFLTCSKIKYFYIAREKIKFPIDLYTLYTFPLKK